MTATARVKWDSTPALLAVEASQKEGLEKGAEIVLAMANAHAPLESGALIGSAAIDYDPLFGASVFYDTVYAARLHQHPEFQFQNGRQGKWLYKAALKSKPHILEVLGSALKIRFRRRG